MDTVIDNIHNILHSDVHRKRLVYDTLDFMDNNGDVYPSEDAPVVMEKVEERINNFEKTFVQAAKDMESLVMSNPTNATIAQLRKDVLQIKTSPVYDFLDQLTNTVYGSKLTIFDLLRDENRRLENAPSVSDYVLTVIRRRK